MIEPLGMVAGALAGGVYGLLADRLAARWPRHADGQVRRLDWRSAVMAVAAALTYGGLAGRWTDPRDLAVLGLFAAALMLLLATDLDQRLLPDVITLPLIGYGVVISLLGPLANLSLNPLLADKPAAMLTAVVAAIAAPGLLLISDLLLHGSLGGGDLKLSVSLGLLCGVSLLLLGFLVATTAFAAVILLLVASHRISLKTAVPFGPALIGAAVVAMLIA
jgi:leader peptidase (prepilin peptidase) / N-methyltransferase